MALQIEYDRSVRPKLDLVDDLHHILGRDGKVPLPQIAVVGTQSSGKSSVLERLSKIPLPRALGLCTRVPLMLSMKGANEKQCIRISYTPKMGHAVEEELSEAEIEQALLRATNAIAGDNKGITDETIKLSIAGPGLPDLTLIDLPGITYNPVGDQPADIDAQVKSLIHKFIDAKETLILCVFAGDVDLQASEALKLARVVDPQGDRTLGVITKVDRMQSHAGLREAILQTGANALNVKLGLIAVRNRSPDELADATGGEAANEEERKTFESIACLRDMPACHLGISALASRLCDLQAENLQKMLPEVKQNLLKQMLATEEQLAKLPECLSAAESFAAFQKISEEFKRVLFYLHQGQYEVLNGRGLSEEDELALHICPRVESILQDYSSSLKQATKSPFAAEAGDYIQDVIEGVSGRSLPNMLADSAFRTLVRQWHQPFRATTQQALEDAIDCMADFVERCVTLVVEGAVGLQPLLQEVVAEAMEKQFKKAESDILRMLEKEQVVVYTLNNYYVTTLKSVRDSISVAASDKEKEEKEKALQVLKEKLGLDQAGIGELMKLHDSHDPMAHQILDMQLSIFCYNKVVRKRLVDGLMQTLHLDFLDFAASKLGGTLSSITQNQTHAALQVTVAVQQERISLEERLSAYRAALKRVGGEFSAIARERRSEQRRKRQCESTSQQGWPKKRAVARRAREDALTAATAASPSDRQCTATSNIVGPPGPAGPPDSVGTSALFTNPFSSGSATASTLFPSTSVFANGWNTASTLFTPSVALGSPFKTEPKQS